ncbi:hypothetical protein T265_06711 [Opisthorchis viverrini]|uniref:Uncharacterized protein n=1 Tax=Opisthorchis viverrini TaxID=6198 RepID=A0A074ZRI0_OPIVI|nr:hypothetical protein T265_06711 [Opisthorchis viverrini]KER25960.1 hypothetical protein T265_06711 [Opisthorchis viverrini]
MQDTSYSRDEFSKSERYSVLRSHKRAGEEIRPMYVRGHKPNILENTLLDYVYDKCIGFYRAISKWISHFRLI